MGGKKTSPSGTKKRPCLAKGEILSIQVLDCGYTGETYPKREGDELVKDRKKTPHSSMGGGTSTSDERSARQRRNLQKGRISATRGGKVKKKKKKKKKKGRRGDKGKS